MNAKDKALRALQRHREVHDGDKGTSGFNGTQQDNAQEPQEATQTLLTATDVNAYKRTGGVTKASIGQSESFQSYMGPKGSEGVSGAAGKDGVAGEMGAKGADGAAGASGAAGSDGRDGIQGDMGPRGTSVLSGARPPLPLDGKDGDFWYDVPDNKMYGPKYRKVWPKGVSLVGAQGTEGPMGLIGDTGAKGEGIDIVGTVANEAALPNGAASGDIYIANDTGNGWLSDGANGWTDLGPIRGPQGLEGPTGATGPAGSDGTDGTDGAKGNTGDTGASGSNGLDGSDGHDGTDGQNSDGGRADSVYTQDQLIEGGGA